MGSFVKDECRLFKNNISGSSSLKFSVDCSKFFSELKPSRYFNVKRSTVLDSSSRAALFCLGFPENNASEQLFRLAGVWDDGTLVFSCCVVVGACFCVLLPAVVVVDNGGVQDSCCE